MGNTISEYKTTAAIVVAVVVGLWSYNQFKSDQKQNKAQPPQKKETIEEQLQKLKREIDVANPSLQDIKRLFTLLANYIKAQTLEVSNQFKYERRKRFPKEKRLTEIAEYFRFSSDSLTKVQKRILDLQGEQAQLMAVVGINQAKIAQYAPQLKTFMQELVFGSQISLQDLKKSLQIKTNYLENHGQKIVDALIQLSSLISQQQKQQIPLFLNIIVSDQAFENDPPLDKQEFDVAYQKHQTEITPQLIRLEKILMPLMGRLQSALLGVQLNGDYDSEHQRDHNEQLRDMRNQNRIENPLEMNQQMMFQQMQQLRVADPQTYQQLMLMMQAQMKR